ncbi:glyoxylate reductase/hydroxypyruvate reductase [Thraustotheca clavata]|uniref:Glyoxylate reductase/hydroxypyruvate reductase n=1 Tax=Thraustotheca clavata TaxID=74557 RepID=A0A1V9Y6W9_9STRA|nr:glyoxylate reductase/hydroxypyruvate reductase [Thraustotheca clavata]
MALSKPRVLVTRYVPYIFEQLERAHVDVDVFERDDVAIPREELLRRVQACDGILCMLTDQIDHEVLASAGSKLKVVSTMSVGYNHISVDECRAKGIAIGFTPGVLDTSTAETAIALTFMAKRHAMASVNSAKNGEWGVWQPFQYCGSDVEGSTVGIVGLGRIGAKYAQIMKTAFNCRILYTGPKEKPEVAEPLRAQFCSLNELLGESDIVSVHCPLTTSTRHLFNADTFPLMKSSAVFINTSRGPVVNQDALYDALVAKQLAAAGLDVTDPEPLPVDNKLFTLPNCTIFPHIGSATIKTRQAMADIAIQNVLAGIYNKPLPHAV